MPSLSNAKVSPSSSTSGNSAPGSFDALAVLLRAAQLVAHAAHNNVKGPTFFSDHPVLGATYAAYEAAYDDVVERAIGLGQAIDLADVTERACEAAEGRLSETSPEAIFTTLLDFDNSICEAIAGITDRSEGVDNLLQGLCEASEKRIYALKQRLG